MKDPYNVIVAGVGGQGNVVGSWLMGSLLVDLGYRVTIGETYGASQRGGSVMSHLRISKVRQYGPFIPPRSADLVMALEPSEAARVLGQFGNPGTVSVVNTRPVYPVDVISGVLSYPVVEELLDIVQSLCARSYLVDATTRALELGNPILANIIMIGAVSGAGLLPFTEEALESAIRENMTADKVEINLMAFRLGRQMVN